MDEKDQLQALSASRQASRTAPVPYVIVRYVAFMLGAFASVAGVVLFFYLISIWPYEFASPRLQGLFDHLLGLSLLVLAQFIPFYSVACGWKTSKWLGSLYFQYYNVRALRRPAVFLDGTSSDVDTAAASLAAYLESHV